MNDLASPHVNGISTVVAGMLVLLGMLAYADVGGPLVIAGGLILAVTLGAFRRSSRDRRA